MEENHKQSNLSVQVCEEIRLNNESQINHEQGTKRKEILVEVKKQLWLAGPLVVVSVLQYCLRMISIMFVGRLGELSLSGASMATSFASVTGFSLLVSWTLSIVLAF
jgi:MATE family multidrug resistance protein